MKANEAPDKIYLVPFGKPIRQPLPQEGSDADTIWSSRPYANSNAGNIEYTRTDAFIEKAVKFINKANLYLYHCISEECDYVDTDKFTEDFRNYMKGE